MSSYIPFWTPNGFTDDPFAYTNADQEELLARYFIMPPYFHSVLGNARSPAPAAVFAPRGAGKSALRRMVEFHAPQGGLVVRYTTFPFGPGETAKGATLDYHLGNLIPDIIIGILASSASGTVSIREENSRLALLRLSQTYLADIDKNRLNRAMESLQTLTEKGRGFLRDWAGHVGTFIGYLWAAASGAAGTPGALQFDVPTPEFNPDPPQDFKILGEIAAACGMGAIYVLIDRVDETDQTQNDRDATYALVKPLLNNLGTVESKPYAFKFFLPSELRGLWEADGGRTDRIPCYSADWDVTRLVQMVTRRLAAYYSGTAAPGLELITGPGLWGGIVPLFAQGSPRDLMRILKLCVDYQVNQDDSATSINEAALEHAVNEFCQQKTVELAGTESVRRLQKITLADFTVDRAAENLGVSPITARKYVRELEQRGVIGRIPERENPGAVGKPATSYAVCDLRVCREAFPDQSLIDFLGRKVRLCGNGHVVIRDWDMWPSVVRHTCPGCGAQVFDTAEEGLESQAPQAMA